MTRLHALGRRRGALAGLAALAVALAAAGCGGAIPSSNGGPAGIGVADGHLVDAAGHTLYLFEGDESGDSYCTGACAAVWPPLETSTAPQALAGLPAGRLGTIERDDGGRQVTFDGHPLYYYAADASTPGSTKGQEVEQFGAEWYLLGRDGKPLEAEDSGNMGGSNGGGGY